MATTYTSTVELRCWKQHTCVACGGRYRYELIRSVRGTGGSAEAARSAAQKAVRSTLETDTDLQPCPTCGLHQPDMIAQRRSSRHWIVLASVFVVAAVLLILVASYTVQFYVVTYLAAFVCAAAAVAFLLLETWNPNRDLAQNRQKAADLVARGALRYEQGQPISEQDLARFARPGLAPLALGALVLLGLSLLAAIAPDVTRAAAGWPANSEAWPPVVGPGDDARIYMNQSINSIKGYWRGKPSASVRDGDRKLTMKATTNDNSWGGTIRAKASEKSSSSTPWVAVVLPNEKKLADKTVTCDIDLAVEYPASMGSSSFATTSSKMHRTLKLDLASAGAGDVYAGLWWGSTSGALAVVLIAGVLLVLAGRSLRSRARPTEVFSPDE